MAQGSSFSFNIIKLLNEGAFGTVSLVQCRSSMRKFVMKEINLQGVSEREQRAAFLEANLLATLRHLHIVSYVQTYLQSGGRLFILTSYCAGGDLHQVIQRQNGIYFDEALVISWLVQICLGLKHLHDHKILHRDLKTKNIFLTHTGTVKIGDLGIARELKHKHEMATTMIGTPSYMSPEVFCSKPYNEKCDVWALGCCLYEVATLEQAFNAISLSVLMEEVLRGKVSVIPEQYSCEFSQLISSMLSQDPENRPAVGEVLLKDFVRKHMNSVGQVKAAYKCKTDMTEGKSANHPSTPVYQSIKFSLQDRLNAQDMCNFIKQFDKKPEECQSECTSSISLNSIISVPDINGNGDGNDNSQQNYGLLHETDLGKKLTFYRVDRLRSRCGFCCGEAFSRNNSKENISSPSDNDIFSSNHSCVAQCSNNSLKDLPKFTPNTASSVPRTPKNNGEISLDFLQNLSHVMNRARADVKGPSNSRLGAPLSTKLCLSSPSLPNLNNCYLCTAKKKYPVSNGGSFVSKESLNGHEFGTWNRPTVIKSAVDLVKRDECRSCANDKGCGKLPRLQDSQKHQPVVLPKASDILHLENHRVADELYPNDTNVDKSLIQQIVTCKKKNGLNSAARQRRREKLVPCPHSTITKSAPASVESFPAL